jgi:hypothetical protein
MLFNFIDDVLNQEGTHMVGQCIPVCAVDERYDAAGGFGCASVVLTLMF